MPYASWPYDQSTSNPLYTLRGRFGREDEQPWADGAPATPPLLDQPDPDGSYQASIATIVRTARGNRAAA